MNFNAHNTDMARARESRVARFVIKNLIQQESISTILDYGCGYGKDVEAYSNAGLLAKGYDPYFRSGDPTGAFDMVTMAYVLNVIPAHFQRVLALQDAFYRVVSGGLLVVATRTDTLIEGLAGKRKWSMFDDGYITSPERKTFQKGFNSNELKDIMINHLNLIDIKTVINTSDALCVVARKA